MASLELDFDRLLVDLGPVYMEVGGGGGGRLKWVRLPACPYNLSFKFEQVYIIGGQG